MKIMLTKAIATEYLGAIPKGTLLDISVEAGEHLIARGFAVPGDPQVVPPIRRVQWGSKKGGSHDGIVREFEDAGPERPTVAEDSCSCADGEDGAAE